MPMHISRFHCTTHVVTCSYYNARTCFRGEGGRERERERELLLMTLPREARRGGFKLKFLFVLKQSAAAAAAADAAAAARRRRLPQAPFQKKKKE